MSGPLENDRHERFAREYLIDLNAGRAYERAGYKARGKSADEAASRLLSRNVKVQARIAELQAERAERTEITADRVLEEMALIGFSDLSHYTVSDEGDVELAEGAPPGAIRALSSIKRKIRTYRRGDQDVREVDVEIKLWSKTQALDSLAKHLGLTGPKGTEDDPIHHKMMTWTDG